MLLQLLRCLTRSLVVQVPDVLIRMPLANASNSPILPAPAVRARPKLRATRATANPSQRITRKVRPVPVSSTLTR